MLDHLHAVYLSLFDRLRGDDDDRVVFLGVDGVPPDLVVIPADGFDLKSGFSGKEAVFTEGPRNGMHKFENSLLYATEPDLDLTDANLFDVTPTVLDLLDIDVDAAFDGENLAHH